MYKTSGIVAKDNTVRYQGTESADPPQDPHQFHDVKVTVRNPRISEWDLSRVPWSPVSGAVLVPRAISLAETAAAALVEEADRLTAACGPIVDRRPNMSGRCFRQQIQFRC